MHASYEKIDEPYRPSVNFCPQPHTYFQLFVVSFLSSKMSKTTLASLQTQVTELTSQFAALSARLDSLAPSVASSVPAEKTKKTKKASKPKDPNAPKKPLSSYLLFSAAQRAEVPEGGVKLTASVLAERWKALTPEQQAAYKLEQVMYDSVPVVLLFYGGSWGLFSTKNFTGWPSESNPYTLPVTYNNELLTVLTHLTKA